MLSRRRVGWITALGAAILLIAGSAVACGGGNDDDNGNGARTASPASETPNGDGGTGNVLHLVSRNTLWVPNELRAKAGEITIEHDNQDGGLLHNVHVYKGTDSTGEDLGTTELEAGPGQQTLKLTLEPGEYVYICDAHPATMTGTLIVE